MVRSALAGLFGRSPFKPMQKHMELVASCAAEAMPLFEALIAGEHDELAQIKARIFALEGQADDVKNEIRSHLPKSLMMPVARRDLLEVLHAQDNVADTVQDIAELLILPRLAVPPAFDELLLPYVRRNIDAVEKCREVIEELDELLETGFRGRQAQRVEAMIGEISVIESETDDQGTELTRRLFEHESDLSAASFVVWYELVRRVGDIADHAQDVGDRLRLLLAR